MNALRAPIASKFTERELVLGADSGRCSPTLPDAGCEVRLKLAAAFRKEVLQISTDIMNKPSKIIRVDAWRVPKIIKNREK